MLLLLEGSDSVLLFVKKQVGVLTLLPSKDGKKPLPINFQAENKLKKKKE
jgi:hypothetical protein